LTTRIAHAPTRPRKNPSQPRSERTVEAIVEATARILETQGLSGFNTNAVADKAGVSVGSLYQYFPNKDALIAALSARERALLGAEIADAARQTAGLNLAKSLRRLARAAIRRQIARPNLARVLDFEEQRLVLDEADRVLTRDIASHMTAVLSIHRAEIRGGDLEAAAFDLIAMTRALIDSAAARGKVDPAALESRVTRAALGYLTGRANVGA
jgi:AcrR family transcriptional regulator